MIVRTARGGGKPTLGLYAALVVLTGAAPAVRAQTPEPGVSTGQVVSVAASAAAFLTPTILGVPSGPPPCAPCDPAGVPAFDRWAIHGERDLVARASDVALVGVAVLTLADLVRLDGGDRRALAALEAAGWTAAATAVLKTVVHRSRPVLYTSEAPTAAASRDTRLSMPSGHASVAFAFGTSYLLARPDPPVAWRIAVPLLTIGAGALRVAAGHHFPTDVLVGAALGALGAWGVHEVRF